MKKILIAVILLPTIIFSQSQRVYVDSRGRDCVGGLGLCSAGTSSKTENFIETTFAKISENSIAMILENKTLSVADQKRMIGKPFSEIKSKENQFFLQDSDFILEENLLKQININPDFHLIKQGKYPLVFEENRCQVIFTLNKK